MSEVTCPYCEHEIELDESEGFDESRIENYECDRCGKIFVFKTTIYVDFEHSSEKAPCLNKEGLHDWVKSPYMTRWHCRVCGQSTRVDPLA